MPSSTESGEQRYEISVLIGPCSAESAEFAMEEVAIHAERALRGFGPAASVGVFKEDDASTEGGINHQVLAEIVMTLREMTADDCDWSRERLQIEARYLLRLIEEKRA